MYPARRDMWSHPKRTKDSPSLDTGASGGLERGNVR